ncbi:hypothetical protein Ae201684P_007281 [Aphanomyces euteiches]|uniref:Uncharacterized protein n=1 Tax=Aphanomyces euteiches TaxID=100861 RepID=A0A6G0X8G7_9STRA|nr:hypothetical protein Ae201684_007320 [Aphanomyces euteiches]KAH9101093.1 hypothetical protein Ae201684P_007281 [Aphanomyces euteiches]
MWAKKDDNSYECPSGLAIPRKVFHAVRQLYGYMSCNKRRYGILTTFTTTFLLKRDHDGKLYISKGIAANRYDPMTVLEAITRLLLTKKPPADDDLSEAGSSPVKDPYAQEMPKLSKSTGKETKKKSKPPTPKSAELITTPKLIVKKTTESSFLSTTSPITMSLPVVAMPVSS